MKPINSDEIELDSDTGDEFDSLFQERPTLASAFGVNHPHPHRDQDAYQKGYEKGLQEGYLKGLKAAAESAARELGITLSNTPCDCPIRQVPEVNGREAPSVGHPLPTARDAPVINSHEPITNGANGHAFPAHDGHRTRLEAINNLKAKVQQPPPSTSVAEVANRPPTPIEVAPEPDIDLLSTTTQDKGYKEPQRPK